MIELSLATAVIAGVVLAAIICGAGWALLAGVASQRTAKMIDVDRNTAHCLLESSPALAAIIRADGRVEMPGRMVDWFGLSRMPRFLADLSEPGGGLGEEDAALIAREINATQKSGRAFTRTVRAQGSDRVLMLRGQRAADQVASPGSAVLWVFDATEAQAEITRLGDELHRMARAYDALTALIEAAPMPMWHRDADLKLTLVNTAYVSAVEASDAEAVITRQIELVERTDGGGPLAKAEAARRGGLPVASRVPVTIAGARRMLQVTDVPLGPSGVAGFAVDIEDLEAARAALRRYLDAQRDMLDRLSAGVAQFSADRALVYANQPFRRIFSMKPEWLTDRPAFDRVLERMREAGRLPEVRDFPHWKDDRREWFTVPGGGIEESWLLADGTHLRVVAQPLPDGGLLLIFEDRTEQAQLSSARDTLLRVRTATFDNLFEALGVFAADGRLQMWNRRFRDAWGFEEELLARHPRVDTLVAEIAPRLANPARARLISDLVRSATGERKQRGGRIAFADGRHFEFAAVPLPDGNALFTMLDISDSRRIERALRDRNEALETADGLKTAFMSAMSYELRTPLTSIGGFAEMLEGGYAGKLTKQAEDYVAAILQSVERLGQMIDDVLDLTQGDAGSLQLDRAQIDLAKLMSECGDAHGEEARARRIDLVIEVDASVGKIDGDAKRIGQAVAHLLRHAIATTPPEGRVLLHADGTAEQARIIVSDDGPGMDEAEAARLFDRFARADEARGEDRALGLGLPLARQFVEAHGGRIGIESEPGMGTLLTILLPRA
ncbi:histidine kinase [Sphingomonas gilva]|uniref:histidine kinase n=1 Tax=Sphingomonas gilva TaxID=2305907 RepID=A0A396RLL9_9SPHN|nr:PAS domain-containing sensor histidine kinase [Sphingomonas gilva]RHW17257.1 histidine kinase [Sphingomonas gilva]